MVRVLLSTCDGAEGLSGFRIPLAELVAAIGRKVTVSIDPARRPSYFDFLDPIDFQAKVEPRI